MRTQNNPMADLLLRVGLVSPTQLEQVFQEQQRWGGRLVPLLIEMGFVQEDKLVPLLRHELRLPIATLDGMRQIPPEALRRVPVALCERFDVIPIGFDGRHNRLQVAMSDPTEHSVLQELRSVSASEVDPYVAGVTPIRRAIRIYFYGESTAEVLRVVPDLSPEPFQHEHPLSNAMMNSAAPPFGVEGSSSNWPDPTRSLPPRSGIHGLPTEPSDWSASAELSVGNAFSTFSPNHEGHNPSPIEGTPKVSVAPESVAALERKVDILEREIQRMRLTFNQLEDRFEEDMQEVQQLLRNRFQEQRMLVRGLLDLLVANGHLRKDDIVQMLNQIAQNQNGK